MRDCQITMEVELQLLFGPTTGVCERLTYFIGKKKNKLISKAKDRLREIKEPI